MNRRDEFLEHARTEMLPKMRDSAFVVSLLDGTVDIKIAVEIGACLLMEKPLLVLALPGAKVPEKLRKFADRVVECDPKTEAGQVAINRAIHEMMAGIG